MRVLLTFTILVLFNAFAQAVPETLSKEQEDKILYMLFENQSRQTVSVDKKETCKKNEPNTWFCEHNTVKKFLIAAIGVRLDARYQRAHQVNCEKITTDSKKAISTRTVNEFASVDLRREASLALPGQWLCTYKFLTSDKHNDVADQTTKPASDVSGEAQASGISFLMNRDLNRIISRHIIVWRL